MAERRPHQRVSTPTQQGLGMIAVIKSVMEDRYLSREIAELTGQKQETVARYLRMLHRAKLVYVAGYGCTYNGGKHPRYKLWAWGPGKEDAKKPARLPYEDVLKRRRERYYRDKIYATEKKALGKQVRGSV